MERDERRRITEALAEMFNKNLGPHKRLRVLAPWTGKMSFPEPQPVINRKIPNKVLGHYHTVQIFVEDAEDKKAAKLKGAAGICEGPSPRSTP